MNNVYMGLDAEDFIFEEGTTFEENYGISDEELNQYGVIECVDEPEVACYRIALENEQNFNAIMSAIMMKEMAVLEATGEAMVYEAVDLREIADKIKEAIKKFWAKVKGVFKKLMDNLNTIALSNKAFVKKYRSADLKMPTKEVSITGYPFNKGNLVIDYVKYGEAVADSIGKNFGKISGLANMDGDKAISQVFAGEAKDRILDGIRGAVLGKAVTAANFSREMHKHVFGSENTQKITLADAGLSNVKAIFNRLETANLDKKDAQASYKEAEKCVKALLKVVKDEIEDGNEHQEKMARIISSLINSTLTIMQSTLSIQTKGLQARALQDRKIANIIVRANAKKGGASGKDISTSESYNMDLEDVVLV